MAGAAVHYRLLWWHATCKNISGYISSKILNPKITNAQVMWLVVTEVRSESFGLMLHAQHIFAILQLYLYNGLLCCEHYIYTSDRRIFEPGHFIGKKQTCQGSMIALPPHQTWGGWVPPTPRTVGAFGTPKGKSGKFVIYRPFQRPRPSIVPPMLYRLLGPWLL